MRQALVIIDCLRYDASDRLNFKDYQKLSKVVSVSNWTMPVIATLLTGLHPTEHRVGPRPKSKEETEIVFLSGMKKGRIRFLDDDIPTILDDKNYRATAEIPMIHVVNKKFSCSWSNATEMGGLSDGLKMAGDKNIQFLLIHLKGGHSPYEYNRNGVQDTNYKNYLIEIDTMKDSMEELASKLANEFDRVVILADHGRIWEEVDNFDYNGRFAHGDAFHLSNLHVPLWVYPHLDIPDKLYDTRMAFEWLSGIDNPTSRQIVLSTSPAYGDYNKGAYTYLFNNELILERFKTKHGFELD